MADWFFTSDLHGQTGLYEQLLALTAAQPAACDKQGPNQCTTGTAGAKGSTAVTGTGTGGSATGGTGTAASAPGTGGTATGTDATNAGATGTGEAAVSTPFTVSDAGFGTSQLLMTLAAALLIGAVVLPPVLSRRLRRADRTPPK